MACAGKKCGEWSLAWDVTWDQNYDWVPKGGGPPVNHPANENPRIANELAAINAKVAEIKDMIDKALKGKGKITGTTMCEKSEKCHCFAPDPPPKNPQGYSATMKFPQTIKSTLNPPPGNLKFDVMVKFTYVPPQGECMEIPKFDGGEWISISPEIIELL